MDNKQLSKEEMLRIVEENISKIENKDFNIYFYVLDTKGNPSGSLEYIYQTALVLSKKGYKVTMLHQEKEFVGVEEWLGTEYAALPHKNIETENVEVNASDFLFIPEIFTNVMSATKKLPCKRVIILQNYNQMSEFMPVGVTPEDLRINDIITTTKVQEGILHDYFPNTRTHVVSPSIKKVFRPATLPQKLIVNVVSKEQTDVNRIIKPFYWKYPIYKWISFRDLRGVSQEMFAEALREGAITICVDDITNFGYSALEAMRCGSILLSKIPQTLTDWNVEKDENGEEHLTDACVWFDHVDRVPDILASVIRTWTLDKIPSVVYEREHKFDNLYTPEAQESDIEKVYEKEIFEKRLNDFKEVRDQFNNTTEKVEE